jgi:hypothetical protein
MNAPVSSEHCVKHGPHAPGECPECDELSEARSIVATTYIPPAPPSSKHRSIADRLLRISEALVSTNALRAREIENIALDVEIHQASLLQHMVGEDGGCVGWCQKCIAEQHE